MARPNPKKGFTLIELIVAVSILSFGVVSVLRSFLGSSSALGSISDRLEALQLLEAKMVALEMDARSGAIKTGSSNDEIVLNNRKAVYNLQVSDLSSEKEIQNFKEVRMGMRWQDGVKEQGESLVTYVENKKEKPG